MSPKQKVIPHLYVNRFFFSLSMFLFTLSNAFVSSGDLSLVNLDQRILDFEEEIIIRNKTPCNQCKKRKCRCPTDHSFCSAPFGPRGIGGLSNIAAFEWHVAPCAIPNTILMNQPLSFNKQKVIRGRHIQSAFPFDSFTLSPGDYQIDVGLANNGGESGPAVNLQLQVFINNQPVFLWPALADTMNSAPPFIEFSTIIHVVGSSSFLQIVPTENVVYDQTETGGTIAYLNILKLDPHIKCCQIHRDHF